LWALLPSGRNLVLLVRGWCAGDACGTLKKGDVHTPVERPPSTTDEDGRCCPLQRDYTIKETNYPRFSDLAKEMEEEGAIKLNKNKDTLEVRLGCCHRHRRLPALPAPNHKGNPQRGKPRRLRLCKQTRGSV
jgi:hypothetical protein